MIKALLLVIVLICYHSFAGMAQFRVVGYFPSWQGNVNTINYSKLTHINYAFILPTNTGGLNTSVMGSTMRLQSLVTLAHASNTKVLIAIGGWNDGDDGAFRQMASSSATRTAFAGSVMSFVNQYNLDGVDIDWEYPYDNPSISEDDGESANFTLMMAELYDSLHNHGKLLTAAVIAQSSTADGVQSGVFSTIDWFNVMAYDNYGDDNHSTWQFANNALNLWLLKGVPKSKLVLGVPFYSIKPSTTSYAAIVAQDNSAAYDDEYNSYRYNGIYTMQDKTDLAKSKASGIMIWELSMDSAIPEYSLVNVIYDYAVSIGAITTGVTDQAEESTTSLWYSQNQLHWSVVNADFNQGQLECYDMTGKNILRAMIDVKTGMFTLPSDLKGIYVFMIRNNQSGLVICKKNQMIF